MFVGLPGGEGHEIVAQELDFSFDISVAAVEASQNGKVILYTVDSRNLLTSGVSDIAEELFSGEVRSLVDGNLSFVGRERKGSPYHATINC
jgi:hypothetical protein